MIRSLHRAQAGITVAVLAVLVGLRFTDVLSTGSTLLLFFIVEVPLLILFAAVTAVRFARIRPSPHTPETGAFDRIVAEEPLLRPAVTELRFFACLGRLLARRHKVPPGALPFGYAKGTMTVPVVMVALSVFELAIVHLIVPWPWLRIALLVLTVWAVLYVLGFFATLIVHPHLIASEQLQLRWGLKTVLVTPLSNVREVTPHTNHAHVRPHAEEALLVLTLSLSTNVRLRFTVPVPASPPVSKRGRPVDFHATEVWCRVDDPAAFVQALSKL